MKLKEIITKVNKSKQFEDKICISEIAEHMDIQVTIFPEQHRITSYFFGSWYCEDTFVGYKAYFLDDEPVAVSSQGGRKSYETIKWVSSDAYKKVRAYVLTFVEEPELNIPLMDPEQEVGETYKINYHGQLFGYHKSIPLLNGVNVKIIECHNGQNRNQYGQYEPSLVKIQWESKGEEWVELKELDFPYNLLKQQF